MKVATVSQDNSKSESKIKRIIDGTNKIVEGNPFFKKKWCALDLAIILTVLIVHY